MPTEVTQLPHFRTLITGHTYVIADFYASWCPPCKTIAPIYNRLSSSYAVPGKFAFIKVNVDEAREIAAEHGIQAMPTFLLFKNCKKVEEIRGADPRALRSVIERVAEEIKNSKEEKKTEEKTKDGEPARKKSGGGEGLSMLERLMQKKK